MVRRPRRHLVAMLAALALVASLGSPVAQAATSPFTDIAGTTFEQDIDWLFAEGITVGCTPTTYCPERAVSRGEMASFLVRMFHLPMTTTDFFTDDDGTTHESDINRLAEADITVGCTPTTFCPTAPVRRDAMASFLTRAVPLTDGAGDNYFRDDDGTTHEADIDRAAAAGITNGCGTWRYCIADSVTRGQMAGFLHRVEKPISPPPHPAPTGPQTLYVGTDGIDAGNACFDEATPCRTVRYAAGRTLDGDSIVIGPGIYAEENIRLTHDVTITGDLGGGTIIDAPSGSFVPVIDAGRDPAGLTVILAHLTLTGGSGPGIQFVGKGSLTVTDSTISGNLAGVVNGAALLTITDSIISGNRDAGVIGGTVIVKRSTISGNAFHGILAGAANVSDSTISENRAFGIYINGNGPLSIVNSTVSGNRTNATRDYMAGGVLIGFGASASISNSTVSGNVGPAVWLHGSTTTMTNATISGNSAAEDGSGLPGGIVLIAYAGVDSVLILRNTLAVGNTSPEPSDVACLDLGWEPVACPPLSKLASIVGIPAGLTLADILVPGGLKDNGGPTKTIALTNAATNPAKGKGDAATCAAAPVNGLDQRGLPRTPPCDIGAYELQP